jgi:flagellar basal-body rod modification protein FlgD
MIDVVSYLNNGLSSTPSDRTASGDLDKDAFMELLVTQMSYQNPLEPMDNTQFVSQLAQFSALEQQQNMAEGLELLALTQTAATNSQMVNLIDKRVVVPGDGFTLDGEKPVEIRFDLEQETAPSEIIITDSEGNVVRTMDLEQLKVGLNQVEFDGKDQDGNQLEAGNYNYIVKTKSGELVDGITQYANYLVDSVKYDGSSILLKSRDITIDLGDVSEVIRK